MAFDKINLNCFQLQNFLYVIFGHEKSGSGSEFAKKSGFSESDSGHHLPELCIEGILIANQARSGLEGHTHCNGNPIYVLPEKELCGLSPNFHIHVSVNDLYIPRIGPHIFLH